MKLFYVPLALSLALSGVASAADVAPDNTKKNQRDVNHNTVTPGDQGEGKGDIAITKEIRRKVMKEKLSMNAKNVKIITVDGVVDRKSVV